MNITLNEREALLIVSALGVFQNRAGQRASWVQRKRMRTLRSRLADAITIGDDAETAALRKAIKKTESNAEKRTALGKEVSALRERIKAEAGITDARIRTGSDEEEE